VLRFLAVLLGVLVLGGFSECFAAVRFAVVGDYGVDNSNSRAVADLVKERIEPEFIVTLGDNNYGGPEDIDHNIGKNYQEYIGNYRGEYGPGAEANRFYPAIGNHDHDPHSGYRAHLEYFTLPGNERYYEVRHGPVHIFVLNSDAHEPDGTSHDSTQASWLRSQLDSSDAPWKLVVFHHTPFSSSAPTARMRWPFQQWGAHAVLAGHAHNYERLLIDGFPYLVNGLGGHSIGPFHSPVGGSEFRYSDNYGVMQVTATDALISFDFYSIGNGGTLIDSFSLEHSEAPPEVSLKLTLLNGEIAISWPAAHRELELEEAASLNTSDWRRVANSPFEQDGERRVVLPLGPSSGFYRLRAR
jgi:tartrate-resistant acid phosphatase type 5